MANNIGRTNPNTRTHTLLSNLKNKVNNFVVFDSQGELVGKVQDLIVDANHRLNLVISNQVNQRITESGHHLAQKHASLFQVQSQRIKKIDNPTKSVFIDLDQSQIEYMPEYIEETPGERKLSQLSENSTKQLAFNQTTNNSIEPINLEDVSEEKIIRLLEERLVVESRKRRIGEVIVRKEIETRMVQVPVRREKLIIEQVSPELKQLAEIDLSQGEISGLELSEVEVERLEVTHVNNGLTVSGEFTSPKIASLLLNAIALEQNHGCKQVRVTITVEDEYHQKKYQEWFDRCSKGQQLKSEK